MNKNDFSTATVVKRFRRLSSLTIVAVILLIFIGGFVRMVGAGMGCPDWPKCFGSWIPPTDVSQLPANYQEIYIDHGYASMEFNAMKTWVEYVNRLIGVLIGFISLATALYSLKLRKIYPQSTYLSILAVFLVAVQGGIGAYVVRTNLHTGMITLHMMVALMILLVLILANLYSYKYDWTLPSIPRYTMLLGFLAVGVTIIQIILGTQVRESIDTIAKLIGADRRSEWLDNIHGVYDMHKYFYYVVVGFVGLWIYKMRSLFVFHKIFKGLILLIIGSIGLEIVLGIAMHHLGIPPWIQPIHLVLATIIAGTEFTLMGVIYFSLKKKEQAPELMQVS